MEDVHIIVDMVMALGIATIAGLVAARLRVPVLLGYVMAGVIIGPYSPGFGADEERVIQLANLGVAFLMFALGAEFSLKDLLQVRKPALTAAAIQIPGTFIIGIFAGQLIGWHLRASILLGGVFAISSSIVMIKLLLDRGETSSPQGRYGFGLSLVQDLSLVPMLALLPVLESGNENLFISVGRSLLEAGVALALVAFLGTRLVPWVLYRVARTQSRELFLLTIVTIALGTAAASYYAGLSLALGAFLAGLIVSESEFDVQVLAEIVPLRDLFATLFFVSLGMLIQPDVVLDNPVALVVLVTFLVGGKAIVASIGFLVARINPLVAVSAGFLAAQIGEFSFVLASSGLDRGIIDSSQYAMIIAVALVSILLSPAVSSAGSTVGDMVGRLPFLRDTELGELHSANESMALRRHVIVCGYGRVGRVLCSALQRRGVAYLVIEINAAIVRELRAQGKPAIYGDAGRLNVLEHAGIEHAQTLAVTVPDLVAASAATRFARSLNTNIAIITRTGGEGEMFTLKSDGASEVVQPEFEAGLEFTRYVLRRLGVSARELEIVTARRRAQFYEQVEGGSVYGDEL